MKNNSQYSKVAKRNSLEPTEKRRTSQFSSVINQANPRNSFGVISQTPKQQNQKPKAPLQKKGSIKSSFQAFASLTTASNDDRKKSVQRDNTEILVTRDSFNKSTNQYGQTVDASSQSNSLINKKFSLDDRSSEQYQIKLQNFSQDCSNEIQSRKFSVQTDTFSSIYGSETPHCQPIPNNKPFQFHQDFSVSLSSDMSKRESVSFEVNKYNNPSQVEPQTIQIVEELTIPNYRQIYQLTNNTNKPTILFNPEAGIQNSNNIIYPVSSYNQLGTENAAVRSFHSNFSANSLKGSFLNNNQPNNQGSQITCVNLQKSFSVNSNNSSLIHTHQNQGNKSVKNSNETFDNQVNHSQFSGVQSVISNTLPCQCTQCLQAQMVYLQQLLAQQQQLYMQQMNGSQTEIGTHMPSQSMSSDNSRITNVVSANMNMLNIQDSSSKICLVEAKNSLLSGSCPSHIDESIPDEILSLKSDEPILTEELEREYRIIRDQIELQKHYEKYVQQESLKYEEYPDEQNYTSRYMPELNIDPNPHLNILKKNYIELPLGEIPEMKESFYEDQSRFTGSAMSKKMHRQSILGSQTLNIHEYAALRNSIHKAQNRKSMDILELNASLVLSHQKNVQSSVEKEKQNRQGHQFDFLNESLPLIKDHSSSRNKLHQKNISQQNSGKQLGQESQLGRQDSVITPRKQRQLSGSNWGTTINKESALSMNSIPVVSSSVQQLINHHRKTSSLTSNQQFLNQLDQAQALSQKENLCSELVSNEKIQNTLRTGLNPLSFPNSYGQTQVKPASSYSYQLVDGAGSDEKNIFSQEFQSSVYKDITTNLQNILCHSNTKSQAQVESTQDKNLNQLILDYSSAKKDCSGSFRNQSQEEREQNKTDKLINYILDQEPYYTSNSQQNTQNSGSRTRRNEQTGTKRVNQVKTSAQKRDTSANNTASLGLQSFYMATENSEGKSTERKLKDGNYFYPVPINLQERYSQTTTLPAFRDQGERIETEPESIGSQSYAIINELISYPTSNRQQVQTSQPRVQRIVQPLVLDKIQVQNSRDAITLKLLQKDVRSRSVEPKNGRIFQKYNALKGAPSQLQSSQKRRIQQTNTKGDYYQPNSQRWSSQPVKTQRFQNPLSPKEYNFYKGSNYPQQNLTQRQSDQQNLVNRLTASRQRGKNQRQVTQKKPQVQDTFREAAKNQVQIMQKQGTVYDRLTQNAPISKTTRIDNFYKSDGNNQQQCPSAKANKTVGSQKKYSKTLFEMSELPTNENIQRSVSAKRQQNQLIVSLTKRKSSIASNNQQEASQISNFNITQVVQYKKDLESHERRLSIEKSQRCDEKSQAISNAYFPTYQTIVNSKNQQFKNYTKPQNSFTARQTKSSSLKRNDAAKQKQMRKQNQIQSSANRDPKHVVINIKTKPTLYSHSVEKPLRTHIESKSPFKTSRKQEVNRNQVKPFGNETPLMNYKLVETQGATMDTPQIRQLKFSNPSVLQQFAKPEFNSTAQKVNGLNLLDSTLQNTLQKSTGDSISNNPFQNSNLASYRESLLVQQPLNFNPSFKLSQDGDLNQATLFQQIIASQVFESGDDDQEIVVENDTPFGEFQEENYQLKPQQNEIEFNLGEEPRSLNLNRISEIQQSVDIQKKINEYYKLKVQQENYYKSLHEKQQQLKQLISKDSNSKDMEHVLKQLEKTDRSRISTVQGFASFNTLEQDFLSFNSHTNPYQNSVNQTLAIEKQIGNFHHGQDINSAYKHQGAPAVNDMSLNQMLLETDRNLIQTPMSKELGIFNSEIMKQGGSSIKNQNFGNRQLLTTQEFKATNEVTQLYTSPTQKRQTKIPQPSMQDTSHEMDINATLDIDNQRIVQNSQNMCMPNSMFFKNQVIKSTSDGMCNVGARSNTSAQFSHHSSKSSRASRQIQSGSDVDVLRQSTDNSPQIRNQRKQNHTKVDLSKILPQSRNDSKNDSSIIIKSFGVENQLMTQTDEFNSSINSSRTAKASLNLNSSIQQSNSKQQKHTNGSRKPNIPPPKLRQYDSMKISNNNSQHAFVQMTPSRIQASPNGSAQKENLSLIRDQIIKKNSQQSSNSQLSQYKADDEQTQTHFHKSSIHSTSKKPHKVDSASKQQSSGERSQFRTLKLSQDEKQILRERVELHRKSLNRREN